MLVRVPNAAIKGTIHARKGSNAAMKGTIHALTGTNAGSSLRVALSTANRMGWLSSDTYIHTYLEALDDHARVHAVGQVPLRLLHQLACVARPGVQRSSGAT